MNYKISDKFDIRIEIRAKVLPVAVPKNEKERMMWETIERHVDFEARILAKSLEDYLEYKTQQEYHYLSKGIET